MLLYDIAVAAPVPGHLTYSQPEGRSAALPAGIRVLVPLGNRLVTGYVLGLAEVKTEELEYEVKSVADVLDIEPIFPSSLLQFFSWISKYYHFPLGEVIRTALPGGLIVRSGRKVVLSQSGIHNLTGEIDALKQQKSWMKRLLDKGELLPGTVATIWRKPSQQRLLKKWQEARWLDISEVIVEPGVRVKRMTVVKLTSQLTPSAQGKSGKQEWPELPADLTKPERTTLELFFAKSKGRLTLPRPELTREYSGAGKALHALAGRGLITLEEQRCYRDPFGCLPPFFPKPEKLTVEQETVLAGLNKSVVAQVFSPFLLFGVTGCGKTEVYLRAAQTCLELGKTVLVLVPEIALASQVEAHFYSRFGDTLAVLHSGLSPGERYDQWQRILDKKVTVVIGARSAVFAPLADLGLVIVDEEHEPAYKQDDGLRYNGRDLAVLRAKFADCPVLLGSATPSVTSFHNAETGKYQLLRMRRRVQNQAMPEVSIVDLGAQKRSRPDLFFSDQLTRALHENMEKRQQSLLFVNRRGFSSFMLCRDCGHIIECKHCKVSLTLHRQKNVLMCHYCGFSLSPQIVCPGCSSRSVVGLGVGSERIEEEVKQLIPHARVARLDSDTTTDRKKYMSILQQVRNHDVDILIGTQMVAKGLHFPKMTLVGVVWADSGLGVPDYKASERVFQLLAQVTGRAGRGELAGRVIIQTYQPDHYAIEFARKHDYEQLYTCEVEQRKPLFYPPFARLVNVKFSGEDEERVAGSANRGAAFLRSCSEKNQIDILGPAPAPLARIKNKYRWQMLLKSVFFTDLHAACDKLLAEKTKICQPGVRMDLDIDPENMM